MGNEWDPQQSTASSESKDATAAGTWSHTAWNQASTRAPEAGYQQQWYYYGAQPAPPAQQQVQQAQQQGNEKVALAGTMSSPPPPPPPPLPSAPPPPAPPPPVATAGWNTASTYPAYNAQQTQPQQSEAAPETSYTQDGSQVNSQTASAGATSYAYATYPSNEQYAYGNSSYQSYGYGYSQQGNESYSQNVGPYASSGAQYQPTSYPSTSTYYSNGVYQPTGAYQGTAYSGNWSDNSSYANYGTYTGYSAPTSSGTYGNTAKYQQPGGYYATIQQAATETSGPPGTEAAVPANGAQAPASTYASVVAHGYSGASQPPPPGTQQPAWPSQASTPVAANGHSQWNVSSNADQYAVHQQVRPQAPLQQQPVAAPYTPQAGHNLFKSPIKIQMNPRMPQTLQTDSSAHRPAYLSIAGKVSTGKPSSNDVSDATFKPGMFPPSLRAYVERALARCKDETQKAVCQQMMKEIITKASSDGTLFTKNWDTEPLFPLPNPSGEGKGDQLFGGHKKIKSSRWEPVTPDTEIKFTNLQNDLSKNNILNQPKQTGSVGWVKRDSPWTKPKTFQSLQQFQQLHLQQTPQSQQQQQQQQQAPQKNLTEQTQAPKITGKRQRKTTLNGDPGASSGSDNETDVGGVTLGSLTTSNPEESKRRQTRTKRFENCKDGTIVAKSFVKGKVGGAISASTRRASALRIALSYGDGNGQAVEDIDWDSLTIRGTCQEIEKRYLRLTSAPDPATVRPEEVLTKALEMVMSTTKNYFYKCEQLKSIRQDLTVQRIRNEFTVKVYEVHARAALEAGDLAEYNQCQTQLKTLYAEGIRGCCNEFAAYSLLYIIFQNGSNRDLVSSIARLSPEAKEDEAVKHALAVRAAVALGNYISFFRLYKTAPNLNFYLMDLYVEKMRFEALRCISRSYRPTLPLEVIARTLGFSNGASVDKEALEECDEWVKAHGGQILVDDSTSERQFDAKASSTTLFMPEPEDAVAHGDANLAVNDFLARAVQG